MTQAISIARIAVELFAPGATINGRNLILHYSTDEIGSKKIMYPVMPFNLLADVGEDWATFKQDAACVMLSAVDTTFTGPFSGLMDDLISFARIDHFLGEALPMIVNYALTHAPPYKHGRTHFVWLSLFNVDSEKDQGLYLGEFKIRSNP